MAKRPTRSVRCTSARRSRGALGLGESARSGRYGRCRRSFGRFAERLSPGWADYKCKRWLATSDANAAASYIAMYARDGLPEPDAPIRVPVLAITGEEDAPAMRAAPVEEALRPLCMQLEVSPLTQCGHYPMEELSSSSARFRPASSRARSSDDPNPRGSSRSTGRCVLFAGCNPDRTRETIMPSPAAVGGEQLTPACCASDELTPCGAGCGV